MEADGTWEAWGARLIYFDKRIAPVRRDNYVGRCSRADLTVQQNFEHTSTTRTFLILGAVRCGTLTSQKALHTWRRDGRMSRIPAHCGGKWVPLRHHHGGSTRSSTPRRHEATTTVTPPMRLISALGRAAPNWKG